MAIVGLVVLGLGIGQRTLWLPPATITAAVGGDITPAPLTVISPEVLDTADGAFTLSITAPGPIQLAVGQERDVTGWVGDAAHTTVTGADAEFTTLQSESTAGTATVPNPAGSDLWVSEENATGELSYTWEAPGHGDWALLLSSDGTAAAPTQISVTTANDTSTPWAVPLMITGSVLLALAALLLLLAPRPSQDGGAGRRTAGRGPADDSAAAPATIAEAQRAETSPPEPTDAAATPAEQPSTPPEQDPKSSFAAGPRARWAAGLTALLLAGGTAPALAEDTPTPEPSPVASADTQQAGLPVLLEAQVQKITAAVATTVTAGDGAKNATELESRVAGQALVTRAANYKIRSTVDSEAAPEPVNSTRLLARVVSTADTWPRSAMVVTQGDNNALPQLLTLVQTGAREPYKLISVSPLLPGQTFPAANKEGAAAVALEDASGLLMSPQAAVTALQETLLTADSPAKASFVDSVYTADVAAYQAQTLEASKDATVVFTHTADAAATVAMRTADGGALVVVGYTFGVDSTPKQDAKVNVPNPAAAALAGGQESTTGVVVNYAEPVVMYIPPTPEGQITIVSAQRALISAAFK